MDKKWQCRDADLLALGLAAPVQERFGQTSQLGGALRERGEALFGCLPNLRFTENIIFPLLSGLSD